MFILPVKIYSYIFISKSYVAVGSDTDSFKLNDVSRHRFFHKRSAKWGGWFQKICFG